MRSNRIVAVAAFIGVVILGVTFLGAARMSGDDGKTASDAQKILAPVKTPSNKGLVVFGNGNVDNGVGLIPLYPETFPQPSKVKKVLVAEGQTVIKDQKLVEFDTELADFAVKEARAGLDQAEAVVRRAEAMVHIADQTLDAHKVAIEATEKTLQGKALEKDAAKIDFDEQKRKAGPLGIGANDPELRIAEKKLEAANKVYDSEKVKLDGLKAIAPVSKKEEAVAGVAEAKAAVAKQKAVLDKALYGLKLMTLTAPGDGKIVRSLVAEGLTFGAQTRQPAFLFQSKGDIVVLAEVDQEFASRVALGQEAVINDDGDPTLKWRGKVKHIADSFLPKRASSSAPDGLLLNDARVLECVISIEMAPNSPTLRVGQRVKVSIGME